MMSVHWPHIIIYFGQPVRCTRRSSDGVQNSKPYRSVTLLYYYYNMVTQSIRMDCWDNNNTVLYARWCTEMIAKDSPYTSAPDQTAVCLIRTETCATCGFVENCDWNCIMYTNSFRRSQPCKGKIIIYNSGRANNNNCCGAPTQCLF